MLIKAEKAVPWKKVLAGIFFLFMARGQDNLCFAFACGAIKCVLGLGGFALSLHNLTFHRCYWENGIPGGGSIPTFAATKQGNKKMAQRLYDYYLRAGELGGVQARTRLSILSKMTSTEAKASADTDEKIAVLETHFRTIQKEFANAGPVKPLATVITDLGGNIVEKLRRQMSVFADLTAQRSLYSDSIQATARRITETLVEAIDVERASIWMFNDDASAIECVDLYVRGKREHTTGVVLKAVDFPAYFRAVKTQRTIAAFNAHTDAATAEFTEVYLKPLGINAMLDVPIWANGKMVGVVCHEHTGDFRKWTTDEETFAYIMGNIVGMAIEKLELQSA